MTIKEVENFYRCDKKKYNLENNQSFWQWLFLEETKFGYNLWLSHENMQEFIDFLVKWYEIKYPDRLIQTHHGEVEPDYKDNPYIKENMDYQALLYRLPYQVLALIKNKYPRCLKINLKWYDKLLPFYRYPSFYAMFDDNTGRFHNNGLEEFLIKNRC